MRVVPSALTADDTVFVPLGDAASAPLDRGTRTWFVHTRDAEETPASRRLSAADFAAEIAPFDEVVIDPAADGSFGAVRGRDRDDAPAHLLWLDEWVPTAADTSRATLAPVPRHTPSGVPRTNRILADLTAAHAGRAFFARWRGPAASAPETRAWLVVVAAGEVDELADELTAAFLLTPHPPVLIGVRHDFPWATRRRMAQG